MSAIVRQLNTQQRWVYNLILSKSYPPCALLSFLIVLFKFNEKKDVLRIMAVTAIENVNIPLSGTSTPV